MITLTNGFQVTRGVRLTRDRMAEGRDARFVIGPVRLTLGPNGRTQWWGSFRAGDELIVCLRSGPELNVVLEARDESLAPISRQELCRRNAFSLRCHVERTGVVFLEADNLSRSRISCDLELVLARASC